MRQAASDPSPEFGCRDHALRLLGVRSWVSGLGCWVLGVGCWVLGAGLDIWMNMGPERCPGFWIGGNLVIPTFLYGPLWTLILRTEESWEFDVMDIGSGLSGLLGLVWTEIGCLDGQKLGPGLGSWVFRRTEIGSGSWVSGQLFTAIPSGVWMSLRSTLPCSKHCPGNV
jgi:hypothetical protein